MCRQEVDRRQDSKMEIKNTIKQNANNIMWVEYWVRKAHPSYKNYELSAKRYDDHRWICEIRLPLIKKTVKSISDKEVNAMLNASEKAMKLINEYMKEHPEIKITNEFKNKHYEIRSDKTGKFISMGISSAYRKKLSQQMMKTMKSSIENINKGVEGFKKLYGTVDDFIVKVFDRQLFKDKTEEEIKDQVHDILMSEFSLILNISTIVVKEEYVVAMGYAVKIEYISRKEAMKLC